LDTGTITACARFIGISSRITIGWQIVFDFSGLHVSGALGDGVRDALGTALGTYRVGPAK